MSTTTSTPPQLGACPHCTSDIATRDVIIRYEKDGHPAVYAACPDCGDIVNPE